MNEYQYMQKMAISATQGGLWGDFTAIKWMSDYLQRPIYVWSNESGMIMAREGCEFQSEPLHLTFGSSHFEPLEKINQNSSITLPIIDNEPVLINLDSNAFEPTF